MKTADVLQYLAEQFPATYGHLPLVEKLNHLALDAYKQGMSDAADISVKAYNKEPRVDTINAILTARDKKESLC
jgi:hypothetical protein